MKKLVLTFIDNDVEKNIRFSLGKGDDDRYLHLPALLVETVNDLISQFNGKTCTFNIIDE